MSLLSWLVSAIIFSTVSEPGAAAEYTSEKSEFQKPLFSFGIVADVQYCDCEPSGSRYYRASLSKLGNALSELKSDSVSFVVNLGDLIDRDYQSYQPVMKIINSTGLKFYHVTGNHDYSVEPRQMKRIPPLEEFRTGYYSFSFKKFRMIFLNGNELSTYGIKDKRISEEVEALLAKHKAAGLPEFSAYTGGISKHQLDWLESELTDASEKGEMAMLFCHFPAWPESNSHNLLNNPEILEVLKKFSNIIAWFSGHNHAGAYGNYNMIHFVTLKGMVETETSNSFSVVEVYSNKIWIKGSGREKSQILAY